VLKAWVKMDDEIIYLENVVLRKRNPGKTIFLQYGNPVI
jgi:hypothetical protein